MISKSSVTNNSDSPASCLIFNHIGGVCTAVDGETICTLYGNESWQNVTVFLVFISTKFFMRLSYLTTIFDEFSAFLTRWYLLLMQLCRQAWHCMAYWPAVICIHVL
jgi:hypothetical protein